MSAGMAKEATPEERERTNSLDCLRSASVDARQSSTRGKVDSSNPFSLAQRSEVPEHPVRQKAGLRAQPPPRASPASSSASGPPSAQPPLAPFAAVGAGSAAAPGRVRFSLRVPLKKF